ncbi:MAG: hypothetical protein MIO93_15740 [ANME-2 cluster archaeon]|nr:hypothetical protein [ANME-2 cluster archaeon]
MNKLFVGRELRMFELKKHMLNLKTKNVIPIAELMETFKKYKGHHVNYDYKHTSYWKGMDR